MQDENRKAARDLLDRFPGIDRAELLEDFVTSCFFDKKNGDKRAAQAVYALNEIEWLAGRNKLRG